MKLRRFETGGASAEIVVLAATLVGAHACGARTGLEDPPSPTLVPVASLGAGGSGSAGTGGSGTGGTGGTAAGGSGGAAPLALRPIAPLSTSHVTSQTPTLHWALPAGANGAVIDLCADRACSQFIGPSINAPGTSVAVPVQLKPGVVFWRGTAMKGDAPVGVQSPVWQFEVGHRSAPLDGSWGTVPDVNGDGLADVLIGAPGIGFDPGHVYVHFGAKGGPAKAPSLVLGNTPSTQLGSSVASAGDVNGDGYADVIVGGAGMMGAGEMHVFLGGPKGPATTPAVTIAGMATGDAYGFSVASAGDVDGDGYADVIIGAFEPVKGPGKAFLHRGGPGGLSTSPAQTLVGLHVDDAFGASVTAGDMNGDGYSDVVVGAYGVSVGTGAAYLYLGGPTGLATTPAAVFSGTSSDDKLGISTSMGDVDGDGIADLLVGAFQTQQGPGMSYLFRGSKGAVSPVALSTLVGPLPMDQFGLSVSCAGDVDGDGYSDAIIGAPGFKNIGAAFVYSGGPKGLSSSATLLFGDVNVFGGAVAIGGDIDGDGFDDVLVGNSNVNQYAGSAAVFLGSKSGPVQPAAIQLFGKAGDRAGAALAWWARRIGQEGGKAGRGRSVNPSG